MVSQRWRPLLVSCIIAVIVWGFAITGYKFSRGMKMTAEKIHAYVEGKDLTKLSGDERARAIRELAAKINGLSLEERRKARVSRAAWGWFEQMTEEEKSWFVEETMPTGFKQMISSFEQLPEERRKRTIDDAIKNLRQAQVQAGFETGNTGGFDTNAPVLSKELEAKVRSIGLKTFYSQSSAQTKAELAPFLEELQRMMESGRPLRRR